VGANRKVIVLGAGPAGLAAGATLIASGTNCVVLEQGARSSDRDREAPADLVTGVGGAGLYSDGKFSFAPSASALWRLEPRSRLTEAYGWVAAVLRGHGIAAPEFPEEMSAAGAAPDGPLKPYLSEYMPLEERMRLVRSLEEDLGGSLWVGEEWALAAADCGVVASSADGRLSASAAVLASGRFGPLQEVPGLRTRFRRVEIGMRVEQAADSFAMDVSPFEGLLDPKWIQRSPDGRHEWRTFCCCRDGEVIDTRFGDLTTVSGRADGASTGRSNFGLNVRFLKEAEGLEALDRILDAARAGSIEVTGAEILDRSAGGVLAELLGIDVLGALAAGLEALGEEVGCSFREATLRLPALEGVGYYPAVDDTLRVAPAVWAAGDATGQFRGLVPALVSGRMAAKAALDALGLD
jgi:uncharacterized FAD-dependent dehydrogenase